MKVRVTYYDSDSLTVEEVVATAKRNYGEFTEVEVFPESNDPLDIIYFGLHKLATYDQLSLLFDAGALYPEKLKDLRSELGSKITSILDQVLRDNETRVK